MAGKSIPWQEYDRWKSAIESSNSARDKNALKEIQRQLIVKYGMDSDDVKNLLKKFAYTV